jgi:hypothetical protein
LPRADRRRNKASERNGDFRAFEGRPELIDGPHLPKDNTPGALARIIGAAIVMTTTERKPDRGDQKLLNKQLAHITQKRNDSILIVMFVVVLFAGMALGAVMFSPESRSMLTVSNETSIP